jgi:hypothetical protein
LEENDSKKVVFTNQSILVEPTTPGNTGIKSNTSFTVIALCNTWFCHGIETVINGYGNDWGYRFIPSHCGVVLNNPAQDYMTYYSVGGNFQNLAYVNTIKQNASNTDVKIMDINGATVHSVTYAATQIRASQTAGFVLGASVVPTYTSDGAFYEALVYDRVLTDVEIQSVLTYLKSKYPFLNA